MAARSIHIHRPANVRYAPIGELVGVADIRALAEPENGGEPAEIPLHGLAFVDVDGETHVYVMAEPERQIVIQQLTRGIVLPDY
ncbi:MAG TPA: hypothetical protein VE985_02115 [Gaiellaceae bacterium]|nr:hypothetical protein [Gaiellaceae bacterium]